MRLPAWSEMIRTVDVPSTSTVYSNACERPASEPTPRPAAAPPMPRNARLLPDCPLPVASPMPPPTSVPTVRDVESVTVVVWTLVMRPY